MNKKQLIVRPVTSQGLTQAEAARRYGVSPSLVSKLLRQWRLEGNTAFHEKSRKPRSHPHQISEEFVVEICDLRAALVASGLDAGPVTIRNLLLLHHQGEHVPARASIARILSRNGLVKPEPKKKPRAAMIRFQAEFPNECWQSDVTSLRLSTGETVEVITWLDDHSRLVMHLSAHWRVTSTLVASTFTSTGKHHGFPASTLTDNGAIYTARFTGGVNQFEKLLRSLNIQQKNGRGSHPQTQGKVERFQQTLKKWLKAQPDAESLTELQTLLDEFTTVYNHQRIHTATNTTPFAAYIQKPKAEPGTEPLERPRIRHDKVDQFGKLSLRYNSEMHHIGLGRTHTGTPVVMLINNRHIIITNKHTGEILADFHLDPTRKYHKAT